jgi:putative transposase
LTYLVEKHPFDPVKQQRHSNPMKRYDYSLAGAYFVTIVTYQRNCRFGEIADGEMVLNQNGKFAFDQ